ITAASGSITTDGSTLVTVQLKDANGNNLGVSSGTVLLSTDHGSLTVVDDHGDGTYTATLTATSPGTATITGTLAGTDITDEETVVVTVGAASVGTTTITAASSRRMTYSHAKITY